MAGADSRAKQSEEKMDWIELKKQKPQDGQTCCLAYVEKGRKQYVMSRYKVIATGGPGYWEHPTSAGHALEVQGKVKYYFVLPEFPKDA